MNLRANIVLQDISQIVLQYKQKIIYPKFIRNFTHFLR